MTASLHLTPEQVRSAKEILARQTQVMSAGMQQALSGKYDKDELARLAKEAGSPGQLKALLTPEQAANYPAYEKEEAAHNARLAANNELLQLQTGLALSPEQEDGAFAALYQANYSQLTGAATPTATNQIDAMRWSLDQKAKALEPVLTPSQMESYRQQQATQLKLINDIMGKMGVPGGSQ